MRYFSNKSLSAKLTMLITTVTTAGIMAGFAAVTVIDARGFRRELAADAALAARLAAEYCVAPLAFGYRDEAGQLLANLSVFEYIVYAAIYDEKGGLFASYRRGDAAPPPERLPAESLGYIEARAPMHHNGRRYGTALLVASADRLAGRTAARARLLAGLAALMAGAALMVSVRAQRVVSDPILKLANLARGVAGGGYSARTGISRADEIGVLAAGFDAMLDGLEARSRERDAAEEALRQAHAGMEATIKERTAALAAANSELEAFTYSASHDLRAPLRRIDGFTSLLEEDYSDQLPAEGREHLARIRAGCSQMAQVIDSLLRLSRMLRQETDFRELDLSAMAEAAAAALREAEPARAVNFEAQPGLTAKGDRVLLGEVLDNLLSNAWKFTGKLRDPVVRFGASQNGGERAYFVKDNGKGFDMKYANKLFRPFQRLHSPAEFPGTGIGLTTVQRIIERHGGRIWAESEEDKGAVFYFTLNTGADGAQRPAERAGAAGDQKGGA